MRRRTTRSRSIGWLQAVCLLVLSAAGAQLTWARLAPRMPTPSVAVHGTDGARTPGTPILHTRAPEPRQADAISEEQPSWFAALPASLAGFAQRTSLDAVAGGRNSSSTTGRSLADSALRQLLRGLQQAKDGQVLTVRHGQLFWENAITHSAAPASTPPPVLRRYSDGSVTSDNPRRGGGGGSQPPQYPADHNHETDAQGGVLDINNATKGVLTTAKGGTAIASYSTGDLLVGNGQRGLSILPIGISADILTVSGSSAAWKPFSTAVQGPSDARYVNTSGDTMTGSLTINLASGTVGLKVLQTMSGARIHADSDLSTSGTLVVNGNARFKSTMTINGITYSFPGSDGSASGRVLATDGAGHLSWTQGTQWTTNGTSVSYNGGSIGIGTSSPKAQLDVVGTLSGARLSISRNANITGALLVMGDVGIGKTSPATKLDVVGTMSGDIVNASNSYQVNGVKILHTTGGNGTYKNIFIGQGAGNTSLTGAGETALGPSALAALTSGSYNTAIGDLALQANPSGAENTGVGVQALNANTSGNYNTAIGVTALFHNTTGSENTAEGDNALATLTTGNYNTAVGRSALAAATTASHNTAVGWHALTVATGLENTGVGSQSMEKLTTGAHNTANGEAALWNVTTGSFDTGLGELAGQTITTGSNNTFLGYGADASVATLTNAAAIGYNASVTCSNCMVLGNGQNVGIGTSSPKGKFYVVGSGSVTGTLSGAIVNATDSYQVNGVKILHTTGGNATYKNIFLGQSAGNTTLTGVGNTALGQSALAAITSGQYNTAVGTLSLQALTSGQQNAAFGFDALGANTTGNYNTANGMYALYSNTTGSSNTAYGHSALGPNTTGANNTAVGNNALGYNTTGNFNVALGYQTLLYATASYNTGLGYAALGTNTTGANNTAGGFEALYYNTTGDDNVAYGYNGLLNNTTGAKNTALGRNAGQTITTGSNNLFLGYGADASANNLTNAIAIGYNASVSASNSMVLGNGVNVGIGKSAPSTKLDVVGTISGSTILGSNGLTTKVISGACSDSNVQATDGTICIDSGDGGRIYFRYGGAWHYAAQTAGFQIPKMVRNGKDETQGLSVGDAVIGRIDETLGDGALHGVWVKFDLQGSILKTLQEHPELLGHGQSISSSELHDLAVQGALRVTGNATFLGDVSVQGVLALSDKQTGVVMVPAGHTKAHVAYVQPFAALPGVTATPKGVVAAFWGVTEESADGFSIELASPLDHDARFSWLAIPIATPDSGSPASSQPSASSLSGSSVSVNTPASSASSVSSSSSSSSIAAAAIAFPVDGSGVPVSSDPLWNACLRHQAPVNQDGSLVSCSRFALGNHRWEQPDLHVTFAWNDERVPAYLDLPAGYRAVVTEETPVVAGDNVEKPNAPETTSGSTRASDATGSVVP